MRRSSIPDAVASALSAPGFFSQARWQPSFDAGSVVLRKGAGAPTYTRATTAFLPWDFEGRPLSVLSGETRFAGMRRVENKLSNTAWQGSGTPHLPSGGGWAYAAATGSTSVADSTLYPGHKELTFAVAGVARQFMNGPAINVAAGDVVLLSVYVSAADASVQPFQALASTGTATYTAAYLMTVSNGSGVMPVGGRIVLKLNVTVAGTVQIRTGIGTSANTSGAMSVTLVAPMVEVITGQSNQNPSEYVSVGANKRNELLQTEAINTAPWGDISTPTVTANGMLGGAAAFQIADDNAAAHEGRRQTLTVPNDSATRYLSIRIAKTSGGTAGIVAVNLSYGGGTPISKNYRINTDTGSCPYSSAFESVTDRGAYWECRGFLANNSSGNTSMNVDLYASVAAAGGVSDAVATTGSATFAAPQLSLSTNNPYFPVGNVYPFHGACVDGVKYFNTTNGNTVASNVVTEAAGTRIPLWGETTQWARGYVGESAAINICHFSENFAGASWIAVGTPVLTASAATCGDVVLSRIEDNDAAALEYYVQAITFTGDATKAISIYVKKGTATGFSIALQDDTVAAERMNIRITWDSDGRPTGISAVTGSVQGIDALANDVFRIRMLSTAVVAANTNLLIIIPVLSDSAANVGYTDMGGVMVVNATASSTYVRTTGAATATRNADFLTYPSAGNVVTAQGTLYAEVYRWGLENSLGNGRAFCVTDGTANNRVELGHTAGATSTFVNMVSGGANQGTPTSTAICNAGAPYKMAAYWKSNLMVMNANMIYATDDTSVTVPAALTLIEVGNTTGGTASQWNGIICDVKAWNRVPPSRFTLSSITSPYREGALGIGLLGHFDPKYVNDPDNANTVWRINSVVDVDLLGNPDIDPFPAWWPVSTVIAGSTDNGATWGGNFLVNRAVSRSDGFAKNHEVPALVYDSGETDPNQKWKMVWLNIYLNKGLGFEPDYRDGTYSWISMRTAPSPAGPWSNEIKLIAGTAYNSSNTLDGGACLFSEAGGTIVTEPGVYTHPTSGFYMVYNVITGGGPSTEITKICRIWKNAGTWTKTDLGQPFSMANDIAYFQALGAAFPATLPDWVNTNGFTACDITNVGGTYYLIYSPQNSASTYLGFAVTAFTDIDTATLQRTAGNPDVIKFLNPTGYHSGAATYASQGTAAGITFSLLDPADIPTIFNIVQTAEQIP